jgi:hypothetical protein
MRRFTIDLRGPVGDGPAVDVRRLCVLDARVGEISANRPAKAMEVNERREMSVG